MHGVAERCGRGVQGERGSISNFLDGLPCTFRQESIPQAVAFEIMLGILTGLTWERIWSVYDVFEGA
jgi:hypothetical protein